MAEREDSWTGNYFTYFTEVEEHFQRARGSGLFLISPKLAWRELVRSIGATNLNALVEGIWQRIPVRNVALPVIRQAFKLYTMP